MRKIIYFCGLTAISIFTQTILADNSSHPANNPANVMNNLNQNLPDTAPPSQNVFQAGSNPQYIKHAEEVTSQITVKKVQLVGAKTVPVEVQKICNSIINKKINFKGIQQLATAVEQAYRNAGFILVQIILPPQEIATTGVIKLQVINGKIKNINFTGDSPKAAQAQLHRYAEQIETEDPVSYHSIDRFLILANQLPGINISATLVPDPNTTGAADLLVKIKQTPVSAFWNTNNRGTKNIGPYQTAVGASLYDLFASDSLSVTGATSLNKFRELSYGNLSYDVVAGTYATEINPNITTTTTHPGGNLSDLDMNGVSNKYDLAITQPLYTSTLKNFNLQTDFYHLDSKNDIFNDNLLYKDSITGLTFGLNYQGVFLQTYHDMTLSVTRGLPILGAPQYLNDPSVANATTTFTRMNFTTSDVRYFTQKISILLGTQFQYSNNTLVSSEQIGFGGQQFGQAFTPYVISGNSGAMASIATRYDLPLFANLKLLQPEIFYDNGMVYYSQVPGNPNHSSAQSAGVGLNIEWRSNLNLNLTLAKPLSITHDDDTSMGWAGFLNVTLSV